jgi:hypothetical protein
VTDQLVVNPLLLNSDGSVARTRAAAAMQGDGPYPLTVGFSTLATASVLIVVFATAYVAFASHAFVDVSVDAELVDRLDAYLAANTHDQLTPLAAVVALTAGAHTLTLANGDGGRTLSNSDDRWSLVILEMPPGAP